MTHLTHEQFEELLQGSRIIPEHLEQCRQCQAKLAEQKALAHRLHSACVNMKSPTELAERIRTQIKQAHPTAQRPFVRTRWRSELSLAAAVLLFVALPVGWFLMSDSASQQAYAELVKIHQHNLSPHREFFTDDDPNNLAKYFTEKLGFSPQLPQMGQGLGIRGCCIKHFRSQAVGSYVVDTPKGVISVIVVTDTPQSIGMKLRKKPNATPQRFWEGSFAHCNMVTVRLGDYSYCAVGEVRHKDLTDLLERLFR